MTQNGLILVTGATGYIGGRLIPRLLSAGHSVRVLVRDARRISGRSWARDVEIFEGDVLQAGSLEVALRGVDVAYYLIHSMMDSADFQDRDIIAARNFGNAARNAGTGRIIYLGGLGNSGTELSKHLESRQVTGDVLRESGVPVTEFRAAIIVGSGSVSFEMIRLLTERLPIMVCPRWVFTRVQPIGIRNVLDYLVGAINLPASTGKIIEIGGTDVLTYGDMMIQYAEVRGLKRHLIPVPVLSPRLSSHWVHWMTPIPKQIARPLIDGLRNEVIVTNDIAKELFPEIRLLDYRTAVQLALERLNASHIETSWSDSMASSQGDKESVLLTNIEGMIVERRQTSVHASREAVFSVFSTLGGDRGWLYMNWAWHIRGIIDRMFGGVGFRRGRRHPDELRVGDALDFWRVETVEVPKAIRLRAEMKVPGKAWLQFEANPTQDGATLLVQTAYFAPKGLAGILYWYLLYPIHSLIFSGMIDRIKRQAESSPREMIPMQIVEN